MRRFATAILIGAVLLLAALATADALRGNSEHETVPATTAAAVPTTTRPRAPGVSGVLQNAGVSGFVLYSDQDCVLHSLLLPGMQDEVVRNEQSGPVLRCHFGSQRGRILPQGAVVNPGGTLVARCRGARVVVTATADNRPRQTIPTCSFAWRSDGGLTYARGGQILEDGRVLFTQQDLRAAARAHPNLGDLQPDSRYTVRATELAWMDADHLVASLEADLPGVEPQFLAVLFEGKKVRGVAVNFGAPLRNWVVSPRGSFAASENGTIMQRLGGSVDPVGNLPPGIASAFSPDEQWLAYATGRSIYLIGTPANRVPQRLIRLPVPARDLVWEPAGRGATGTSTTAG